MAERPPPPGAPDLEALFGAARRSPPAASDAFLARLAADADAACPAPPARRTRRILRGRLGVLVAAIGGWPAVAGLASAAVAGLWIGMAAPDLVLPPSVDGAAGAGFDLVDLMPGLGDLAVEG
ncbi:dihydroorotate dehydrogenase [Rhodobacteraceae bacterium CCMM004]|nr:dihydroorotate dehydrogenase [Rhodobacteraceae bacterium CCMM004]